MPNESRLKQNLPYSMINVVGRDNSFESLVCQKLALASRNTLDSPN